MPEQSAMMQLIGNYYAVQVPDDATEFKVHKYPISGWYLIRQDESVLNAWKIKLNGYYKILCLSDEVTEEQALKVIGDFFYPNHNYKDFSKISIGRSSFYGLSPIESFASLLNSQSITKGRWVILERIN